MLDIHSHVLPDVDDGCEGMDSAVEMLKNEVSNGVTDLFCTPHYRANFTKTPAELKEAFEGLKQRAKEENIPINLYLGQEIACKEGVRSLLRNGDVITMNDTKFVLVELDLFTPCEANEIVYSLVMDGYKPIVAHLERYGYVDLEEAREIRSAGGLIQVNAESIVGAGKKTFWKFIKLLFKNGLVDFVASDYHYNRQCVMAEAKKVVAKKFGKDAAEVVFELGKRKLCK